MSGAMVGAAAITAAGAYAGSQAQGDSKSGGQAYYTMQMMPQELQSKFLSTMQGMPGGVNVGFGGQQFPMGYGPLLRMANTLYRPSGAIPNDTSPSGLASGLSAAAPWAWMAANNAQRDAVLGVPSSGNSLYYNSNNPYQWTPQGSDQWYGNW